MSKIRMIRKNVISILILTVILFVSIGPSFVMAKNMEWVVTTIHNENEASRNIGADPRSGYPREGIAINSKGEVFVADPKNHVIRKIDSLGNETIVLGNKELSSIKVENKSDAVEFAPTYIAIDANDNLFVYNYKDSHLYKVDKQNRVKRFLDLVGKRLAGITPDKKGNLWITLSANHSIERISPDGNVSFVIGSLKEKGFVDGNMVNARFSYPGDIALGTDNALYIADQGNSAIRKMDLSTFEVTTVANTKKGTETDGDPIMQALQENLLSITVAPNGTIYFGQVDGTIGEIKNGVVTTILGQQDELGHLDGIGLQTKFNVPRYITAKDNHTLYITDLFNGVVRKAVYGPATVTGVTIQDKPVELIVGETFTLVPIVSSPNAVNKKVTYALSNYGIVKVDVNGKITAVKPGNVMIAVTTVEGGFTDTLSIKVSPPASDTTAN